MLLHAGHKKNCLGFNERSNLYSRQFMLPIKAALCINHIVICLMCSYMLQLIYLLAGQCS